MDHNIRNYGETMFKLYSKACEYVLRILVRIPPKKAGDRFSLAELCRQADVPEAYVRKIFQSLSRQGMLEASTGPGGGYRLLKSPEDISLLDLVLAIDGEDVFDHCIMGLPQCGHANPCSVHNMWIDMKERITDELSAQTLKDLMAAAKN